MSAIEEQQKLRQYLNEVASLQQVFGNGLYLNCKGALRIFDAFTAKLQPGGEYEAFADQFQALIGEASQDIDALRSGIEALIAGLEAFEAANPGILGVKPS